MNETRPSRSNHCGVCVYLRLCLCVFAGGVRARFHRTTWRSCRAGLVRLSHADKLAPVFDGMRLSVHFIQRPIPDFQFENSLTEARLAKATGG